MRDSVRWHFWRLVDQYGASVLGGIAAALCGVTLLVWTFALRLPALREAEASASRVETPAPQSTVADGAADSSRRSSPLPAHVVGDLLARAAQSASISLDEVSFDRSGGFGLPELNSYVRAHGTYASVKRFLATTLDDPRQLSLRRLRLSPRAGAHGQLNAEIEFVSAALKPN